MVKGKGQEAGRNIEIILQPGKMEDHPLTVCGEACNQGMPPIVGNPAEDLQRSGDLGIKNPDSPGGITVIGQ